MLQYLFEIKEKCDVIAVVCLTLISEDVILYTLNGLPSTYNAFKTSIITNLQPISLDDLYALLCSEELNIANDNLKGMSIQSKQTFRFDNKRKGLK